MKKEKNKDGVCPPSELTFERRCIPSNWKLCSMPMQNRCIRCGQTWVVGTKAPICRIQLKKGEKDEMIAEGKLDKLVGRFEKHGDGSYSYL